MALNKNAMKTLRETLPKASRIKPIYVHAKSKKTDLALPLKAPTSPSACSDPKTTSTSTISARKAIPSLRRAWASSTPACPTRRPPCQKPEAVPAPGNIDPADFRQLRSRMLSTALAFADLDGKVCNNTSVVLLIEWKGKRLLFVGDAEWDGELQGRQEGQLRLERDVEFAQGQAERSARLSTRSAIMAASTPPRGE